MGSKLRGYKTALYVMHFFFVLPGFIALFAASACAHEMVACTMEAKLCPDGSYVSRTGPDCEFAPCPSGAGIAPDYGIGAPVYPEDSYGGGEDGQAPETVPAPEERATPPQLRLND